MENNRKHILYSTWYWMNTQQERHKVDPAWKDLKTFIKDLGDRPTEQHRLHKLNSDLGYVRGNVVWRLMLKHDPNAKSWAQRNTDRFKEYKLKHRFGLSGYEYNSLLEKQNYRCAICGVHSDEYHQNLSVDHCHTTGKIRGLLCSDCNFMLGRAKDNINTLLKGVSYLQGLTL